MFNEIFENLLRQDVLAGSHCVRGMRKHSGLEYEGKVKEISTLRLFALTWSSHEVLVGLARKHTQKVQDVEQKILVYRRHRPYKLFVSPDGVGLI